jgi:hypothetical protein
MPVTRAFKSNNQMSTLTVEDQPNLQKITLSEREELRIEIEKEKTAFIKVSFACTECRAISVTSFVSVGVRNGRVVRNGARKG